MDDRGGLARHARGHVGVAHPARRGDRPAGGDRAASGQPVPASRAGGAAGPGTSPRAARCALAAARLRPTATLAPRALRARAPAGAGLVRLGLGVALVVIERGPRDLSVLRM